MNTTRSSHWSVTINNPTDAEQEQIARARQKGWKITGQEEVGKEGTRHLQLHLATPQVRFSAVKKAFPRSHIEVARNPVALENYVNKEETRVATLPTSQDKYPSLSKFWQLVLKEIDARNWLHADGTKWYRDCFHELDYKEATYDRSPDCRKEFAMIVLDFCFEKLIEKGYHVDSYYSPPNQNLWKKFHYSILVRSRAEIDMQTARQTDDAFDSDDDNDVVEHTPDAISSAQVPVQAPCPPPPPPGPPPPGWKGGKY